MGWYPGADVIVVLLTDWILGFAASGFCWFGSIAASVLRGAEKDG
jgi:hypothetical protein